MNSEQFAKLLLQSTHLDDQDVKEYLERLQSRLQTEVVSILLLVIRPSRPSLTTFFQLQAINAFNRQLTFSCDFSTYN
jgi:hypothetical protein